MADDKGQITPEELLAPVVVAYKAFDDEIENAKDLSQLEELRIRYLKKRSVLATQKKLIRNVIPDRRGEGGSGLQQFEQTITQRIADKERVLKNSVESARTARESIDVTVPGRRPRPGHLHPITLMRQRIEDIFVSLGYAVEDDREIETDFYNFDALNIPEGHPARDPQDTFYTT
jgi:phenylalanyl-tRNA synthetase alpha chain